MSKRVKIWLFTGLAVLATVGLITGLVWITRPKPVDIDMNLPVAVEAKFVVKKMYLLEGNITCVSGTTVDVLAEVMADSADYHASSFDKDKMETANNDLAK